MLSCTSIYFDSFFQNESEAVGVNKLIGRISVRRNGQALSVCGGGQSGLDWVYILYDCVLCVSELLYVDR